jgi:glycosyltransferase involved in cell wall biosynthesis
MIKLTIITINYNNAIGLKKTIESVVNQIYKNFEFVVIDGKSNDESVSVINNFGDKISYYSSEKDNGIYNAMNKGIKAANGEFLLFLNSGDLLFDNYTIENIFDKLDSSIGIIYGNAIMVSEKEKLAYIYPESLPFSFFYDKTLCHQSVFIKKELFGETGYNEQNKIVSDWEFFTEKIILNKVKYKHIQQFICQYELNGMSSFESNIEQTKKEKKRFFDKYFSSFIDDYHAMQPLNVKRLNQIIYIKNHQIAWRFLKWFSSFLLLFLPKYKLIERNKIEIRKCK